MEKYICCKRNLYFIVCILETVVSQTTDVTAAVGEKATILCSLPEQFPAFNGPDPTNPGSSVGYTLQDDPTINSVLPHKARLAVTDGNLVISNTQLSDAGSYKCSYGLSQIEIFLKVGCSLLKAPTNGAVDKTFGEPNDVANFTCKTGYTLVGDSSLTCQADGTWTAAEPTCQGTTTTTTTTTLTSTTTTTTPPPTTTTTIPSTTTAISTTTTTATPTTTTTITTTTMPTTRTTTTTTPSTTARPTTQSPTTTPSTSTSSTPSTTTPSNTRGDSNTSLIAMIVVVSVIGGILVISIVFMILVMVYGISGLPLSTRRKGTHHTPAVDKHHCHHRHHKHHKRRERSEHSFYQPQNVLAGYSFYRGGVDNPVFQESMDYPNTPVLYHKDANEMFHAPRYDEEPPEYQYAVNWEGLD